MKKNYFILTLCLLFLGLTQTFAQGINDMFPITPTSVASHTAVLSGDWDSPATWGGTSTNDIPGEGAMVHIPENIIVDYDLVAADAVHIFIIRLDGTLNVDQPNANRKTKFIFDTLITSDDSTLNITSNTAIHGDVDIEIRPFDIMGFSGRSSWTTEQKAKFKDHRVVKKYNNVASGDDRFDTVTEANSSANPLTITRTFVANVPDGIGVLGRHNWDPLQLSLGIITMGDVNIEGMEKTNMVMLGANADNGDNSISLESTPSNWNDNDHIIITSGGNDDATNNGEDLVRINGNVNSSTVNLKSSLAKKHHGRNMSATLGDVRPYVGNLTRSITFSSPQTTNVDERGHFMAMNMGNNPDVVVKYATFRRMGRTDKSTPTDDFYFNNWREPGAPISKVSTLGLECAEMAAVVKDQVTNPRGRYSIHLHKLGAANMAKQAKIIGNVVWDNPGWGITHHDSHADVSKNVVYDVTGAGIVSETGSETGVWADNLVVNIKAGHNGDVYESSLYYDDILFSGVGLGMKGRAVLCKGNVIADAKFGVRVINFNNSISHLDRVDALALKTSRGTVYEVDNFPLSVNGYSKYGDGVLPLEAALIMENTTIIDCNTGMKSIERDMGVNHESRSIFNGFIAWGIKTGLAITYQADYSYKNVYISGDGSPNNLGVDLWKHSHNHIFENIVMADLEYGIKVSKLVLQNNTAQTAGPKVRNNGFTPWIFMDFDYSDNVNNLYYLEIDNPNVNTFYQYNQHTDNTIILPSSEFTNDRETTFTQLEESVIDYTSTGDDALRFTVDGIITDDLGSYNMGIQQSLAQGDLRYGYPKRIYQFASKAKFRQYLTANGVYKNDNNEYYFIIKESLPNRRSYKYTEFDVRVKILNPDTGQAPFNNPQTESASALLPQNQLISRLATVSQKSTKNNGFYNDGQRVNVNTMDTRDQPISYVAENAVDGNNNGRENVNYYQQGEVTFAGSASRTKSQFEPYYDLDFGELKMIKHFDLWNTVKLPNDGHTIETHDTGFEDFYVFISQTPFTDLTDQTSAGIANSSIAYKYKYEGASKRKVSQSDIDVVGRYMRIQSYKPTNTFLRFAEIEVIGKKYLGTLSNNDFKVTDLIKAYPNPTNGQITVNLGNTFNKVNYQLTNMLGQNILNITEKNTAKSQLSFEGSAGIYFLTINADGKTKVIKLIKK